MFALFAKWVALRPERLYRLPVARPIQPTRPFAGQNAIQLLDSLDGVQLSESELTSRIEMAKANLAEAMRPKGYSPVATWPQRASTVPDSK